MDTVSEARRERPREGSGRSPLPVPTTWAYGSGTLPESPMTLTELVLSLSVVSSNPYYSKDHFSIDDDRLRRRVGHPWGERSILCRPDRPLVGASTYPIPPRHLLRLCGACERKLTKMIKELV